MPDPKEAPATPLTMSAEAYTALLKVVTRTRSKPLLDCFSELYATQRDAEALRARVAELEQGLKESNMALIASIFDGSDDDLSQHDENVHEALLKRARAAEAEVAMLREFIIKWHDSFPCDCTMYQGGAWKHAADCPLRAALSAQASDSKEGAS